MKTTYLFAPLASCLLIASCQKTQNTSSRPDEQFRNQLMSSTNLILQSGNMDAESLDFLMSDISGASENALRQASSACKTITNDPSVDVYPHTRTIVLNSCTTCEGEVVTGTKVTTFYVDPATAQPGDLLSEETYSNLSIDGYTVSADVSTYVVSTSPLTLHIVSTKSIQQTGADGGSRSYTSDRTWTRIAGEGTTDESDDVYSITGTETGTENLHGGYVADVTAEIDTENPLIRSNSCCHFIQGSETITLDVKSRGGYTLTEVLDYGSGTCDDQGTLSINGGTAQTVTIPLRFFPLTE